MGACKDSRIRGEADVRVRVWLLASKPPASFLQLFFPPNPPQLFPLLAWNKNIFFFTCLETAKRWGGSPDVNN